MSVAEQIFEKAQVLPESAQKAVLDLVDKLAKKNGGSLEIPRRKRVQLPLIDSKEPGILDLTNADIEELLA
jgi:hypothetical protein